jgi:DNA-binding NarL/FixJ family response regulator
MRFKKHHQGSDRWDETQLSLPEARVSLLLAGNAPNKEIADRLHVSQAVIAKRISGLLRGLHLSNRGQLIRWTMQHEEAFMGGAINGTGSLKIPDIEVMRLLEHSDAEIGTRLQIPEATVTLRISELLLLLSVASRQDLQLWGTQHPEALELGWADTDLHAMGCHCGLCKILSFIFGGVLL